MERRIRFLISGFICLALLVGCKADNEISGDIGSTSPDMLANSFSIIEAQTSKVLSTSEIDAESSTGSAIEFTLSQMPNNLTIYLSGSPLSLGQSFDTDDIAAGRVTIDQDGTEVSTDSFEVSFGPGNSVTSTVNVTVQSFFTDKTGATDHDAYGAGTPADPYLIGTVAQWQDLAGDNTAWGASYRLKENLDFSAVTDMTPIGTMANPFSGTFDGNEKIISNLSQTSTSSYRGLFGYIQGASASIQKLALRDPVVAGAGNTGSMIGWLEEGTVEELASFGAGCDVTGGSGHHRGALIGHVNPNGTVRNVFANCAMGTTGGGSGSGGVVGHHEGVLENCYFANSGVGINYQPASGNHSIGGIIGLATGGGMSVSDCFVDTDIETNTASTTGRLVIGNNGSAPVDLFYASNRSCTNLGTGSCGTPGATGIDTTVQVGYFYDATNPPMSLWDFSTVWLERPGDYPIFIWLDGEL